MAVEEIKHDIVPAHLAVEAMRDNGYKNAAYALAELMDNALQAKASRVDLLCGQREEEVNGRKRTRIDQIAVLDNGTGMDSATLQISLQFGNGRYLERVNHTGIGRFGMGLPASSVSQCKRVDVWSWQNGIETAVHTFLDLDKIKCKEQIVIPAPKINSIPAIWKEVSDNFGKSGTLVVWSQIDRCMWKTAAAIINNSEFLIGRLYRRFLHSKKARIRMVAFDLENPKTSLIEKDALPNDPMYLMDKTSCPAPYADKPLFKEYAVRVFDIEYKGEQHQVTVRFSYADEEARKKDQSGRSDYGSHAARNVGVSLIRADRELELHEGWNIKYDTRERWWGVEVDFPPALDDLFGVTNNKQAANNFVELAQIDIDDLLKGGKTIHQLRDEWINNNDPRGPLLEIAQVIDKNIRTLRNLLKAQRVNTRSQTRHDTSHAEQVATAATKDRQNEGHAGGSDKDENMPPEQRVEAVVKNLEAEGISPTVAEEKAATTISSNLKYLFANADLQSPAFFSVRPSAGVLLITLNITHPAYGKLVEVLQESTEGATEDDLKLRLENALDGLKILLTAWARYEDEQPDGKRKEAAQDARTDWGRVARDFLSVPE
jgi:hypothetical protein